MRTADLVIHAAGSLGKHLLRTGLTTLGIAVGIASLAGMLAFGRGLQQNFAEQLGRLDLLNYVVIYGSDTAKDLRLRAHRDETPNASRGDGRVMDEAFLDELRRLDGVETAVPDVRLPARIQLRGGRQFLFVRVLSRKDLDHMPVELLAGRKYEPGEPDAILLPEDIVRDLGDLRPTDILGLEIEITTVRLSPWRLAASALLGETGPSPLAETSHTRRVVGVVKELRMGRSVLAGEEILLSPAAAEGMEGLELGSVWDLFGRGGGNGGYRMVNVKMASPQQVPALRDQLDRWGLESFAVVDRMGRIEEMFFFMDMILVAVGMIAILVAALGIVNTMVMSVLERRQEIGLFKALGATDGDVMGIFLVECGLIGLAGGGLGLLGSWAISHGIDAIINVRAAAEGLPAMRYFRFSPGLLAGAMVFSLVVSLTAGLYPAWRAARVDPVRALRHD